MKRISHKKKKKRKKLVIHHEANNSETIWPWKVSYLIPLLDYNHRHKINHKYIYLALKIIMHWK